MKLNDIIKKAAIGIAMTGALAGTADAQYAIPRTKTPMESNIGTPEYAAAVKKVWDFKQVMTQELQNSEAVCNMANFAVYHGAANRNPSQTQGWVFSAYGETAFQQETVDMSFMLYDFDNNGIDKGDSLKVFISIKNNLEELSSVTMDETCKSNLTPNYLFKKYTPRNSPGVAVTDRDWFFANQTYENGGFKKGLYFLPLELFTKYKAANGLTEEDLVTCELRFADLDKNGVDEGDVFTRMCTGTDSVDFDMHNSIVLDGRKGNYTLELSEGKRDDTLVLTELKK